MNNHLEKLGKWVAGEIKNATPMEFFFLKFAFIVVGFFGSTGHLLK